MRIGFDIDGTLTNFEKFIFDNAISYMKKNFNMAVVNDNGYDLDEVFDIENQLLAKGYSAIDAAAKAKKILNDFWEKYYPKYILEPFRNGVKENINKLYEEGNEIFIISSRKKATESNFKGGFVRNSVKAQFLLNNVKYHKMILLANDEDKLQAIEDNYIDIMVDDKPEMLKKVARFTDAVCINSNYNITHDLPNNVKRVDSYDDYAVYNVINDMIKEMKTPLLSEDAKMTNSPSEDKLWLKNYSKADMKWSLQKVSPYERISKATKYFPDYTVTSYFKKRMKSKEFNELVDAYAKRLNEQGIGKGDIVPLLVVNNPETVIIIAALLKVMATIVPISPQETAISIEKKLKEFNDKKQLKMLYLSNFWIEKENCFASDKVKSICENLNINNVVYSSVTDSMPFLISTGYKMQIKNKKATYDSRFTSIYEEIAKGKKISTELNIKYDNDYSAVIIYTGGSVEAKGVMLSPDNLDAEIRHFLNSKIGIKRDEKISGILPFDHIYGLLVNLILPISKGMEVVLRPKPERKKLDQLVLDERINNFATIPVLINELIRNPRLAKADLSHVKQIFSGSDAISDKTLEKIKEFFKERNSDISIIDGYGSSELTAMCLENGVPIISAIPKIVKPGTQKELGYNEVGELCVSADTLMQGYYNNPEKTKKAMQVHEDGKIWFHTGDLAFIDTDGKVVTQGRIDQDVIKVNGQMVNLYAISKIVEKHPSVQKCVTLGYPDEKKGKVPVVIIETGTAIVDSQFKNEILELCGKSLSYYEQPQNIILINFLPLTGRGKVDRKALVEIYESEAEKIPGIKGKVLTYSNKYAGR